MNNTEQQTTGGERSQTEQTSTARATTMKCESGILFIYAQMSKHTRLLQMISLFRLHFNLILQSLRGAKQYFAENADENPLGMDAESLFVLASFEPH